MNDLGEIFHKIGWGVLLAAVIIFILGQPATASICSQTAIVFFVVAIVFNVTKLLNR